MNALREAVAGRYAGLKKQGEERPVNLLTGAYILALSAIALLSISAHVVLGLVVEDQETTGTVINLSAQQRTLSQSIALHAERYRLAGEEVERQALGDSVEELRRVHALLLEGGHDNLLPDEMPAEIHAIYFDPAHRLSERLLSLADAGALLAAPVSSSADQSAGLATIRGLTDGSLRRDLSRVVTIYEEASYERIELLETLQGGVLAIIIGTLLAEALLIFRPLVRRVHTYASQLFRLAMTDTMTGTSNRRAFMELSQREISRAGRHGHALSVLMMDIDKFKSINDTFGHAVGDEAIKHLVACAEAVLRPEDTVGRLGGEEFAVIMPYTNAEQAATVGERIRAHVEATVLTASTGQQIPFTVSIGVCPVDAADETVEPALNHADMALYQSKTGGRNRVTLFEPGMAMA